MGYMTNMNWIKPIRFNVQSSRQHSLFTEKPNMIEIHSEFLMMLQFLPQTWFHICPYKRQNTLKAHNLEISMHINHISHEIIMEHSMIVLWTEYVGKRQSACRGFVSRSNEMKDGIYFGYLTGNIGESKPVSIRTIWIVYFHVCPSSQAVFP
jgi:hypothetical protein